MVLISFDIDTIIAAKHELPDNDCLLIVVFEADYNDGRWNVLYDEGPGFRTVTKTYIEDDLIALVKQYDLRHRHELGNTAIADHQVAQREAPLRRLDRRRAIDRNRHGPPRHQHNHDRQTRPDP